MGRARTYLEGVTESFSMILISLTSVCALYLMSFSSFFDADDPSLDLRVFASSSRGLPYSPLSSSIKDASCMVPFLMRILLAMIWSLISLKTRRSFPVFDNLCRKYHMVFRSGNLSGYPRKLRNDIRSRISLSVCGSERLYHCCNSRIFTIGMGS